MKKPVRKRKWRVNLIVSYCDQKVGEINRVNVLEFLKKISSIYNLDYAISENHQFKYDEGVENPFPESEYDIFYFRSNEHTRISAKELRTTINSLFPYSITSHYDGVEFWTQLNKFLKDYPFPKKFYRPMKYPYVEFYNGSKMELMVPYEQVMEVIEKGQNSLMN